MIAEPTAHPAKPKTNSFIEEEMLIQHLKEQRPVAFKYLYSNYSSALYGIIFSIVYDEHLTNDVLQESFIKIWRNFGDYDAGKSRLFTWMHSIARNCAIDSIRSKHYRNNKKNVENSTNNYFDDRHSSLNEQTIGLRKFVNSLNPNLKDIICLSYFSGYTDDEIGLILNMPSGTVKTRKRNALVVLRKIMRD